MPSDARSHMRNVTIDTNASSGIGSPGFSFFHWRRVINWLAETNHVEITSSTAPR